MGKRQYWQWRECVGKRYYLQWRESSPGPREEALWQTWWPTQRYPSIGEARAHRQEGVARSPSLWSEDLGFAVRRRRGAGGSTLPRARLVGSWWGGPAWWIVFLSSGLLAYYPRQHSRRTFAGTVSRVGKWCHIRSPTLGYLSKRSALSKLCIMSIAEALSFGSMYNAFLAEGVSDDAEGILTMLKVYM